MVDKSRTTAITRFSSIARQAVLHNRSKFIPKHQHTLQFQKKTSDNGLEVADEKPDVDDICTGVDILIKIQKTRIRWSTL